MSCGDPKCLCGHGLGVDEPGPRGESGPSGLSVVYVVTGTTESGDSVGPFAYATKPTDEMLCALVHSIDGLSEDELKDPDAELGPGAFGSYCHINVDEVKLYPF